MVSILAVSLAAQFSTAADQDSQPEHQRDE